MTASGPTPGVREGAAGAAAASLVVQTSFLGDVVLTTPLLHELAQRGPVDVVVTPAAAPLLASNPDVRAVITYDKRGRDRGWGGLGRVAERARAHSDGPPRVAYLAQGSWRSAALAWRTDARTRVGFDTSPGRLLYTHRVPHQDDRHHAERLWRLAYFDTPTIDPAPEALRPRLFPGETERRAVDSLLGALREPFVALAPGSVWGSKRWPYFAELAARLAPQHVLVVVGAREDAELARVIAGSVPRDRVIDATGRLTLLGSTELIHRAALLVTNDSLPQHLAAAVGTPTITIFGPTVPAFGFGPLAPRSQSLGVDGLSCRPCHHHGPPRCPLGHWGCMRQLGAEAVAGAARALLTEARPVTGTL